MKKAASRLILLTSAVALALSAPIEPLFPGETMHCWPEFCQSALLSPGQKDGGARKVLLGARARAVAVTRTWDRLAAPAVKAGVSLSITPNCDANHCGA